MKQFVFKYFSLEFTTSHYLSGGPSFTRMPSSSWGHTDPQKQNYTTISDSGFALKGTTKEDLLPAEIKGKAYAIPADTMPFRIVDINLVIEDGEVVQFQVRNDAFLPWFVTEFKAKNPGISFTVIHEGDEMKFTISSLEILGDDTLEKGYYIYQLIVYS